MAERDLVLVGGGHTHALLIRRLAMKPIPGVRVTLVSEQTLTPYSGMLPGLVAGHYDFSDTHIDLNKLCRRAGVRFIASRMKALDPDRQNLTLDGQPPLEYDVVSLDTGSTPDRHLPGAKEHAIGVKPVSHFHAEWEILLAESSQRDGLPRNWGVVGAGAGGVELVLAMAWRLRGHKDRLFHLIYPGHEILRGYPIGVVRAARRALADAGVQLHPDFSVAKVTADGVVSEQGDQIALDRALLCTPAQAPEWPDEAGLATANGGFIAVEKTLQSCSHSTVFATGDIAEMIADPRPKAGVYAVRQAPFLHHNLRRWFAGEVLKPVRLQRQFLSLLSLGDQRASGHRNGLSFTGRWVWRWKDRIDRQFMTALNEFEPPPMADIGSMQGDVMPMHCAGCGSKLGPDLLHDTLVQLPHFEREAIIPALGKAEDALCWTPTPGMLSVQSVDGFRAFSDDLYRLGKVCVHHALSDLYAMNATPMSAQIWINLAFDHPRLQKRDFKRLMLGVAEALQDSQTTLGGGHSTEGAETHVSVTANGEVGPDQRWQKTGGQPDDWLVLTKPLGTGVILAADMTGDAPAAAVDAAWKSMLRSNGPAIERLRSLNPNSVTDVTGFGLLGHLLEMLDDSLTATLWLDRIPALNGARELLRAGFQSSLTPHLLPYWLRCGLRDGLTLEDAALLIDPQTSGGLLAAVPSHSTDAPPELTHGWVIGRITGTASFDQTVTLRRQWQSDDDHH